ncbi:hypothetical protein GCK32_008915 [Trichostrongylus colubriformis]|uniref:Uncharacterized protein n=1 Tax=Trichostrongylus colubriformis TaxID=6319 RepID=A0AAN8FZL7_TRICO
MFVMKLIAFSCILEQANAYQRNEGGKKPEPTEEQYKGMDLISWTLLGYTVSQVQTMYSQNNSEKLYQNNAVLNEFKERILDDTDTSTEEKQFIFFFAWMQPKLTPVRILIVAL